MSPPWVMNKCIASIRIHIMFNLRDCSTVSGLFIGAGADFSTSIRDCAYTNETKAGSIAWIMVCSENRNFVGGLTDIQPVLLGSFATNAVTKCGYYYL